MRRLLPLLLLTALLAGLAGCGSKTDTLGPGRPDRLRVMLDFFPNADHTGLYVAQRRGLFGKVGLDVQVLPPPDPAAPLKLLAAGKVDLAISYEPEVLLARDRAQALVSVGAIVQRPLTSLIALPESHIRGAADLGGRKVGTAGIPYQAAYLRTIARRAGVSGTSAVDVGFNLNQALLSHKVDATLGGFSTYEGVQLAQRRRHPVVIGVDRLGVPTYSELVVVARAEYLKHHGSQVRRFVQTLGRGYALARADPRRGVDDLVSAVPDLRAQRALQIASLRALGPSLFPPAGKPFGFQDPAAWTRYAAWMRRNGLLRRPPDAKAALTDEFLAGEGI